MTRFYRAYIADQWKSVCQFSKHSDNFHKLYNIEFYRVELASDGLVLMLQLETTEKYPYLKV